MGSHIAKPSNKSMVDRLVEQHSYIKSPSVEGVFRAVDRAMYFDLEEGEAIDPYDDDPWRRGNLHLSAPCIYAKVVEALDLKPGLSFLNLGSGTGYLNTVIGLLVGPYGVNHGIEFHSDVVDYAYKRLQQFKQHSHAIDKYDFAEPVFIRGNCLNLNPNSRYDRIYLGAACLPDLENFMKKLIKPNGGILVMPYENHLMRYVRVSETEWSSEKLMDVNFTLMIRQDENDTTITMPLSQAKSLKEICRIAIRQQLRLKANSINPDLFNSDNIDSRRLRKAKAERELLLRDERRSSKVDNLQYTLKNDKCGRSRGAQKNSYRPSQCQRTECSWSQCGSYDNEDPVDCIEGPSQPQETSDLRDSPFNGRVMTRSASRRLQDRNAVPEASTQVDKPTDPPNLQDSSPTSRDASANEDNFDTSSVESSDSGADNNNGSLRRTGFPAGCCPFSRRGSTLVDRVIVGRNANLDVGPPSILPFQRGMARLIEHSSSSSSSSPPDLNDGLRMIEELPFYHPDYFGRQMVLDWPGLLSIHNNDAGLDLVYPESTSDSSDSNLSDLILDGDTTSEASWDSFFENSNEVSDIQSACSSRFQTPTRYLDEEEIDGISADPSPSMEPSPSTSRNMLQCSGVKKTDTISKTKLTSYSRNNHDRLIGPEGSTSNDQEPVARRLRPKRVPLEMANEGSSGTGEREASQVQRQDRPAPGCSREESRDRKHECSSQRGQVHSNHCNSNNQNHRRRHHHHHHDHHSHHHHHSKHSKSLCSTHSTFSSPSSNQTSESTHSSMHLSVDSSSAVASQSTSNASIAAHRHLHNPHHHHHHHNYQSQPQETFTGRVLITTGLGTTLSLATRHYLPSTRRSGGSFRLFERRSLGSIEPNRHHHCHLQRLDRKRKRLSSSESSETSNASSPSRQGRGSGSATSSRGSCERSRRLCSGCSQSPSNAATSLSGTSNNRAAATLLSPRSLAESPAARSLRAGASSRSSGQANSSSSKSFCLPDASSGCSRTRPLNTNHRRPSQVTSSATRCTANQAASSSLVKSRYTSESASRSLEPQSTEAATTSRRVVGCSSSRHCQDCQALTIANKKRLKEIEPRRRAERKRRERKKRRRRENECERYHNILSSYIRQLPLPRVLHSYLDYERNL